MHEHPDPDGPIDERAGAWSSCGEGALRAYASRWEDMLHGGDHADYGWTYVEALPVALAGDREWWEAGGPRRAARACGTTCSTSPWSRPSS